ncbi:MAG: HD domain-containing phosphohydrolase [Gemmatimonadota bacterium]
MSLAASFLTTLGRSIATMSLYKEGHAARERAVRGAYEALLRLQEEEPRPLFTFLGDEVVCGTRPVRDLKSWEWGPRLAGAGIQRLEFEPGVQVDDFEEFLEEVLARVTMAVLGTAGARQMRNTRIRFGAVGMKGEGGGDEQEPPPPATTNLSLSDEAQTIRWLHERVQQERRLPLAEAEAVVRSLSLAMHGDQQLVMPLLKLRNFDEYTTTHSLNVAVLAMGLAEHVNLDARDVRAFGVAGLLHDIGKVNIPIDVLTKPGKLTPEERTMINRHPVEGARIIIKTEEHLDLAAVVAYEHHIMLDGGGYPQLNFARKCHEASKMVHICDVYDALRTNRPYRAAWPAEKVLNYIMEKANSEFDPRLARDFTEMMRLREERRALADDWGEPPAA